MSETLAWPWHNRRYPAGAMVCGQLPNYRDGYSQLNAWCKVRLSFQRAWDRMHARQRRRAREELWPHDLGGEA